MFLTLSEEDGELLRSLLPLIERHADSIVEAFYRHLLDFESTRRFLTDETTVRRLKDVQKAYLLEAFQGVYDEAYCRRKVHIGRVHYRVGLDPEWYLGAYHLYQRLLSPLIMSHLRELGRSDEEILNHLLAVNRVMTFDMEFALEAYFGALHDELVREKEQYQMLTVRLRETNRSLSDLMEQLEDRVKERTSALQASQELLLQSEKMAAIGKMASQMAHEIRNPLSAVILNLELLLDELDAFEPDQATEARTLVRTVLNEANKMNNTIRDYLNIARTPQVRTEPADLNAIIEEQMAFLSATLRRANVGLTLNLADGLPLIALDIEQFRRVLHNLVKNSLDAMPQGGTLSIKTALDGDTVTMAVTDTGIGMTDDVRERIFQPFYTTKEKGLGIGLTVVQEVIIAHGGAITCESRRDYGTTFRVSLPIDRGSAPETIPSTSATVEERE
jgi:signal transduction histidine kinase